MELAKALLHWLWRRLDLPVWPLFAAVGIGLVAAAVVDAFRIRARVAALGAMAARRGGTLVRGWRFWSPVAAIGTLRACASPAWIEMPAPTAGRLRLDSRDIPDRRVRKGREERHRTGDWAFDEAFDAVASSTAFAETALDGDVRADLLKLDGLGRGMAPEDEDGKSFHRLRVDLDGRRLHARFRYPLGVEDLQKAVALVEKLAARLRPFA